MNKLLKFISCIFVIIITIKTSTSQCVVCIEAPSLITCGETANLLGDGYITSIYSDDFNNWSTPTTPNPSLWANISSGGTTNSNCTGSPTTTSSCAGASAGGDFLWFPSGSVIARVARTVPIPVPAGGTIFFEFKMEGQGGSCDGPDLTNEGIFLQYRTSPLNPWQDLGANQAPFSTNPPPYTNEAYFIPPGNGNPLSPQYNTWAQYSIPIPPPAFSATTEFRWYQSSASGNTWDFWGLENVNIVPAGPGGASFLWSNGQTSQNINVNPTNATNYTLTYSDGITTCSTSVVVDVSPPIVSPSIVPNPLNPCPGATDLTADVSFNTCNYNLYMFDNGGDGWITVPQTSTSIDNRVEVFVDGVSQGIYTLNNGYGPTMYSFTVNNNGTMSVDFLSGGPDPQECVYVLEDNLGNVVSAQGITTSPTIPVWPPPLPLPNGAFGVTPLNINTFTTNCPTNNLYNYSWTTSPNGTTTGISNPNNQNTNVTTATTQDYLVTVTDVNNSGCVSDSIITVIGSGGSWDFTNINPNPACEGDCIDLNFSSNVSSGNYNIIIEMIDANGSSSNLFTIDNNGNNVATGNPISLCPTISSLVQNVSFNVTSLIDVSDPNNCEIAITNSSQTVTFNSVPNAGNAPLNPIVFCTSDQITDISNILSGNPDNSGIWTYSGSGTAPVNLPYSGLNYNFDPSIYPDGDYTYTVSNAPCPSDAQTITINIENPPYAGQLPPLTINMCIGSSLNLNSQFIINPTPNTPVWTDITSSIPGSSISNNFIPINTGTYTLRSTIAATANCPDEFTDLTVQVNDIPTVTFSTVPQICLGESIDLNLNLTGTAPFIVTITDNINPAFNITIDASGNDISTGLPPVVTPSTVGLTTYTITNISDNFCSSSVSSQNSIINVITPPNSGSLIAPLSVCSDDLNIYDLSNQLLGQDLNGYWIDALGVQYPNNSSFNFNSSMPGGNYTYVVSSNACPDDLTIVPVNIILSPNIGISNSQSICINNYGIGNLFNLDNLLAGSPDPGTWYYSGTPVPSNINPNTYGVGSFTFDYIVNGTPPCANQTISSVLTINPAPVVGSFNSISPSTTQGYNIQLDLVMSVGSPPFTIDILDDDVPFNTGTMFIGSGMNGTLNMTPNVIPTTNYFISLVTDGNGCTNTYSNSVPVNVIPYPIIDPFTTSTPEICEDNIATIDFDMTQGVVPVTVNYEVNGILMTPIVLNNTGVSTFNIPNSMLNFGINTISIISIIDVNNEAAPNIPNDIQIIYNPNPAASFVTTTPEICFNQDAILEFDILAGTAPFTINYSRNSIVQAPSIIINNLGTQQEILNPSPPIGNNTYEIINIIDFEGCIGYINTNEDILVRELPDIDITISGDNPICYGQSTEILFPVLSGTAPFNLSIMEGSNNTTLNIDPNGLIGGNPYTINPNETTIYSLLSVTDSYGCMQDLDDYKTVIVNPLPEVEITGTKEICKDEITEINFNFTEGFSPWVLSYNVNSINAVPFSLSDSFSTVTVSPSITSTYTYNTITDINNCSSNINDEIIITVNQLPEITITGGGEICDDGSTVNVIFTTSNGTPSFDIEYTIGLENKIISNIGYSHTIATNQAGTYKINNITDSKGCSAKQINGSVEVIVNPVPIASFTAYPQPADITNPVIYFTDNSINHNSGVWFFDDNSTEVTNFGEISHRFSDADSGTYFVELYVESNEGCYNSEIKKIIIDKAFIFYIPDAFTPNGDLVNDIFKPFIDGIQEYEFNIFSRQGQKLFHTKDINVGWDGYINSKNNYAIAGNYAYSINIVDLHGKIRKFQGDFMLIR
tara:strand:+ start:422 stop:5818 length:5397 start_codon:yes stop_codon:yes gene_type:complete